ncbi:MAG: hypothetical protein ROR55_09545 [Devosia sp.]
MIESDFLKAVRAAPLTELEKHLLEYMEDNFIESFGPWSFFGFDNFEYFTSMGNFAKENYPYMKLFPIAMRPDNEDCYYIDMESRRVCIVYTGGEVPTSLAHTEMDIRQWFMDLPKPIIQTIQNWKNDD